MTLGATKDRGRWWTEGDKLCMKWFRWFDAKPRCMTLQRDGNKVYWSEGSGENGTATITEAQPVVVAVAPSPPKKQKRVETAAVAVEDPTPPVVDSVAQLPRDAAVFGYGASIASSAAAALGKALPGSAPSEAKASKLGMDEPAANEETPAPVHEEAAPSPSEEPAPRAQAESAPPPRKVKAAHVAPHAPAARKSAPKPQSAAALPKPAQVSFRVAGVGDGDTLNVRSGPSEYHPSVGRIPPGGRGGADRRRLPRRVVPGPARPPKGLGQPLLSRRGRQPAPLGATDFKQIIAVGASRRSIGYCVDLSAASDRACTIGFMLS